MGCGSSEMEKLEEVSEFVASLFKIGIENWDNVS